MNRSAEVVIVGGGLAGLTCAHFFASAGISFRLLEANESTGGRVRTDEVDGFLLDRGFQVFLTAYPEARQVLDYSALELSAFEPGALVRFNGAFRRFSDPWRRPSCLLATALSPVATLSDKLRVASFRSHTSRDRLEDLYARENQTTMNLLRRRGFSEVVIKRFFRPFLGGVFLDQQLVTSSRMCEFVFRMFSQGDAALPSTGMQRIPQQLESSLPQGSVLTNSAVDSIENNEVVLSTGERLSGRAIVVATEEPVAWKLLGLSKPANARRVKTLYFSSPKPPIEEPILVLDGEGKGPVNNLCVPSQIADGYAPRGQSLISLTVLKESTDRDSLLKEVLVQMHEWFGTQVDSWRHLRTYEIEYALPVMDSSSQEPLIKSAIIADGIFICGDHCDTASINGAMASGRRAAEAVVEFLKTE